jgi:hypothetical protein
MSSWPAFGWSGFPRALDIGEHRAVVRFIRVRRS